MNSSLLFTLIFIGCLLTGLVSQCSGHGGRNKRESLLKPAKAVLDRQNEKDLNEPEMMRQQAISNDDKAFKSNLANHLALTGDAEVPKMSKQMAKLQSENLQILRQMNEAHERHKWKHRKNHQDDFEPEGLKHLGKRSVGFAGGESLTVFQKQIAQKSHPEDGPAAARHSALLKHMREKRHLLKSAQMNAHSEHSRLKRSAQAPEVFGASEDSPRPARSRAQLSAQRSSWGLSSYKGRPPRYHEDGKYQPRHRPADQDQYGTSHQRHRRPGPSHYHWSGYDFLPSRQLAGAAFTYGPVQRLANQYHRRQQNWISPDDNFSHGRDDLSDQDLQYPHRAL